VQAVGAKRAHMAGRPPERLVDHLVVRPPPTVTAPCKFLLWQRRLAPLACPAHASLSFYHIALALKPPFPTRRLAMDFVHVMSQALVQVSVPAFVCDLTAGSAQYGAKCCSLDTACGRVRQRI